MKLKLCVFFLFCSMVLSSIELEDYYEYIGEYESVSGFCLEWALNDTEIISEGSISRLVNGVYERFEVIESSRFSIEKKTSNNGGFRLNIREEGSFICNLSDSNLNYIDPETQVLFLEEHHFKNRIIFLPNMMIVSESMIMNDDLPDGIEKFQYVLYRKVIPPNGK